MLFPMAMEMDGITGTTLFVLFLIFVPLMMLFSYVVQGILMAFFQSAWAVAYLRLRVDANTPIMVEDTSVKAGI